MIRFTKRVGELELVFEAPTIKEVIELKKAIEESGKVKQRLSFGDSIHGSIQGNEPNVLVVSDANRGGAA